MNLKQTFEQYLDEAFAIHDLAENSIRSYRNRFQTFLDFLDDPDIDVQSALKYESIISYFTWLRSQNYQPTTLYSKRQILAAFCNWAYERGLISEKMDFRLKHPPKPRRVYLTPEEANRMEKAAFGGASRLAVLHLRDRAAFTLLHETEIPLSELSELSIDDYDASAGTLQIGPTVVLLSNELCTYLNDLFARTEDFGTMELFTSRNGRPWHPQAIRQAIRRHRKSASLPTLEKGQRLHPKRWSAEQRTVFVETAVVPYNNSIEQSKLIIGLGLHCGLRRAEMVSIKTGDVDLHNRQLYVIGKGCKERIVALNTHISSLLQPIVHNRTSDQPLLINRNGLALRVKRINSIVSVLAERAGITYKRVTPHVLRHTFATRLSEYGVSITVVQTLLGHSRLEETGRYIHPSADYIVEAVEQLVQG
jgi:integrase/recombinase XerC